MHTPHVATAEAKLRLAYYAGVWNRSRRPRVVVLLVAVLAMSIADLVMTLTYATSVGMIELNPLARAMMHGGTAVELIAWKLATVLLGTGILYFIRHTRGGEVGAWVCALVLGALTAHWINYNREAPLLTREINAISGGEGTNFVQMIDQ